ncbi:MBL fold metallo-hydrolase [Sorangium sp. So ce375]|uniref:MBL fold metallo-hydrolase n=1 Tax=Sorangium sp. So ce375 TaxID=3133306 RepID=UPI003F5BC4D1
MNRDKLYLRSNVVMEPLVSQWYAWLYLIAPSTAPLYVANQHLKIMQSFVEKPMLHVAALKNPQLIGGPFINHGVDKVPEIKRLLEVTAREQAALVELAAALKALDGLLSEHDRGMSLEELYPRVPEPLRGYVELCYDLRNQPSARLVEAMLYRSPYYREASQSLLLWRMNRDERSFIFSTPRLEDEASLLLRRPFRAPAVRELCELRARPAPFDHYKELLDAPADKEELVRSFLTDEPPPPPPRYEGDGVRVRYFGHACVLIESRGVSILTDPSVSYRYPTDLPRYTLDDLPARIDYVLITHAHADHLMLETLLAIRPRFGTVIVPRSNGSLEDPSLRLALRQIGFDNVVELDELEEIEIEGGAIVGLPFFGEHGDLNIRAKLAYLVRLQEKTIVAAADSNALEPMLYRRIRDVFGAVDTLFLGMECEGAPMSWAYGPLMMAPLARKMDQSRRLCGSDAQRAGEIVDLLGARQVFVYAMGQEPWLGHVMGLRYTEASPQIVQSNELVARCQASGVSAERPYCLQEIEFLP